MDLGPARFKISFFETINVIARALTRNQTCNIFHYLKIGRANRVSVFMYQDIARMSRKVKVAHLARSCITSKGDVVGELLTHRFDGFDVRTTSYFSLGLSREIFRALTLVLLHETALLLTEICHVYSSRENS